MLSQNLIEKDEYIEEITSYDSNYDTNLKERKKRLKTQKKLKLTILSIILLFFVLPFSFNWLSDNVFIGKTKNSVIKFNQNSEFINSSETIFANNFFLGTKNLGTINTKNPLMKDMPQGRPMERLTARLRALASQNPSLTPGIFIMDYRTGNYVSINAEQEFPTASIIKLPILFQVFRRKEMGLADLNEKMVLSEHFVTDGSGFLQYRPVGSIFTIDELTKRMIRESDNSATNMLLAKIGGVNEFNKAVRDWGFNTTHMTEWLPDLTGTNVSTPKDLGKILYNIDNSEFLSLPSRAAIVEIMSKVKNHFLIQEGLPPNAQFIHKTGDIGEMLGDAGIVILPDGRKYIIVMMVKRPHNAYSAKQFIIDASKTVYNSFASYDL